MTGHPDIQAAMWEIISKFDVNNSLSEIDCPTLVLAGEVDPSTSPAMGAAMAEAISGAEFIVLPDTSHMAMLESADAVNTALAGFIGRY